MKPRRSAGPTFEIKGASYPIPSLRLFRSDLTALQVELRAKVASAPSMLVNAPVVIDFGALSGGAVDVGRLVEIVRGERLVPVGICNSDGSVQAEALAAGLGLLKAPGGRPSRNPEESVKSEASAKPEAPSPEPPAAADRPEVGARVVEQSVRSGQKIYARARDLVVVAGVNAGAEVIADGHIHVYGRLRGRALAGAQGDESARIFCLGLEAELVAIAGIYRLLEQPDETLREKPVQVFLDEDRLRVVPL